MRRLTNAGKRFGDAVRGFRLDKGITQQKLADDVGVDLSYLGEIERGRQNPSLAIIVSIANALDVTVQQIVKKAGL
jgi:XRE family transcriptional regulator, regulator of sulfur utilization